MQTAPCALTTARWQMIPVCAGLRSERTEVLRMPEHIPTNINASLYNAWFRKEYPELFECEIKEVVESCEECGFCEVSEGKRHED